MARKSLGEQWSFNFTIVDCRFINFELLTIDLKSTRVPQNFELPYVTCKTQTFDFFQIHCHCCFNVVVSCVFGFTDLKFIVLVCRTPQRHIKPQHYGNNESGFGGIWKCVLCMWCNEGVHSFEELLRDLGLKVESLNFSSCYFSVENIRSQTCLYKKNV